MSTLKLKVAKSGRVNPVTKKKGFVARVLINFRYDFFFVVANIRTFFLLCFLKNAYLCRVDAIMASSTD